MISDPRTTPDSRAGRMLFAVLVAVGAYVVQFKLFARMACSGRSPYAPSSSP
jgi:hypothetical protein